MSHLEYHILEESEQRHGVMPPYIGFIPFSRGQKQIPGPIYRNLNPQTTHRMGQEPVFPEIFEGSGRDFFEDDPFFQWSPVAQ